MGGKGGAEGLSWRRKCDKRGGAREIVCSENYPSMSP